MQARVLDALGEVRPYLESHGGNVELLEVDGSTVRLRMQGSCSGCPSSAMTLKLAIENAIQKVAPEIEEVIAEEAGARRRRLAAASDRARPAAAPAIDGAWTTIGGPARRWRSGGVVVKEIQGTPLALLRIGAGSYAYRAQLSRLRAFAGRRRAERHELTCAGCGNRYDALRAGRGLDLPELHLEPVPLLEGEDGLVRVALPALA